MLLTSSAFNDGANIPKKFTCDGGNINPELLIQNVPEGAESLALIMHDPDAPRAGGFTHWVVWNIAPTTALIKEESVPPGSMEGNNGAGKQGYMGPCPPSGAHHYEFHLYALDAKLDLPEGSDKVPLEKGIKGHLIEEATLVGLYRRGN
jgi:Raf kinase inhibitor-like YbhB/YbcL family protein